MLQGVAFVPPEFPEGCPARSSLALSAALGADVILSFVKNCLAVRLDQMFPKYNKVFVDGRIACPFGCAHKKWFAEVKYDKAA